MQYKFLYDDDDDDDDQIGTQFLREINRKSYVLYQTVTSRGPDHGFSGPWGMKAIAGSSYIYLQIAMALLWPLCVADADIIFLPCGFFFFFSSPNLGGHRVDVYHTSTHGVALVRIQNAGLKCATCGSLEIQDAKMMQKIVI